MEYICPSCRLQVTQSQPHAGLVSISALKDSELYKCRCCDSYLHCFLGIWEVLSAGQCEHQGSQSGSGAHNRVQPQPGTHPYFKE
jgi:hypothetical protein